MRRKNYEVDHRPVEMHGEITYQPLRPGALPFGKDAEGPLYRAEDRQHPHDKLIPALIYRVAVTQSPRFKRPLPVLLQVPGRTGIRFHRGTKPAHSKGCILVSASNEQLLTELWLKEQQEHNETRIEFCRAEQ